MVQNGRGHHILILAAGASRRFGGVKLTAPYKGKPLIGWVIDAALRASAERVTVVLGAHDDVLRETGLFAPGERLHTVPSKSWAHGLSASLCSGLSSLPSDARAVLIMLGDMPQVSTGVIEALFAAVDAGAAVAVPFHKGQRGNPVAFDRRMFPALRALEGDTGARRLLDTLPGVVEVPWDDPGILYDVDHPGDLPI